MSYQITASGVVDYPPGASFGPRTMADFEFVWLLTGTARWRVWGQELGLQPGSLALARPGMRDSFEWDRTGMTRHAYVHFSPGADAAVGEECPLRRVLGPDDPLAGMLSYLLWLLQDTSPGAHDRAPQVLTLIVTIFSAGPLPSDTDVEPLPEAVRRTADFLIKRWSSGTLRPATLGELAQAASLSRVQLSRIFASRFGVGPVSAVELLRLRTAEDLLSRGNLPMSDIASRCGFADSYHFSRRFRAVYGIPPRRYRSAGLPPGVNSPLSEAGLLTLHRYLWREIIGPQP